MDEPCHYAIHGTTGTGLSTELRAVAEERSRVSMVVALDLVDHFSRIVGDDAALQHVQAWEVLLLAGLAIHGGAKELLGEEWTAPYLHEFQEIVNALRPASAESRPPTIDVIKLASSVAAVVGGPLVGGLAGEGLRMLGEAGKSARWDFEIGRRKDSLDAQDPRVQRLLDAVNVGVPGWWPVSDAFASWEEMLQGIGGDDAAAAALVAALLEREPGTGALGGALRQAGVGLDELTAELRSATDPGATLARLARARGLISAEHVIERQAAPAVLRALDHDADIEDARARRNAKVHAALTAWHTGAGRADDWSLTEAELSSWAGTAPAEVPALTTERPEHWNAVYWLEATLGRDAPSPAALAWARELAYIDVVAHWEQAYGPGRSALGARQVQDASATERPRSEAPGAIRQRMQRDHAHRLADLADLLRRRGRHDEAERLARQALDIVETSLGPGHPDVAAVLDVLARVLAAQGRYDESVNVLRRAVAITDRVLGSSHPAAVARRRALVPLETGPRAASPFSGQAPPDVERALSILGREDGIEADAILAKLTKDARADVRALLLAQSREHHRQVLELRLMLVTLDPENTSLQRDLMITYNELGDVEMQIGNVAMARTHFEAGLDIARKLAAADPGNAEWQRDLSVSYNKLGDVERAAGNLDDALSLIREDLDIARKLAAADPGNAEWQRDLISSEVTLARLASEAHKPAEARRHLEAAKSVLARLDAAGLLRGDALLEQYRQGMLAFERKLAP